VNPAVSKFIDIFLGVVSYELQHSDDGHLLSEQCDRWIEDHPVFARTAILVVGGVLTLHLSNALPESFDPMSKKLWKRILSLI
jgi:hypothetical protein